MATLQALNPAIHGHLRIAPERIEALGAELNMVPVMLGEFHKLAVQYPIALTKNAETGQFVCVALFGFEDNENLFWQQGRWQGLYTPLNIRRQPFFVGRDEKQEPIVCIDPDSDCVLETGSEALFDEQGQASPYLCKMQDILAQLLAGEEDTRAFVDELQARELLTPLRLEITFADRSTRQVRGLYTVDEEKLKTLDETSLCELHRRGYLGPIYTLVTTLGQIYALIEKKNARLDHLSAA